MGIFSTIISGITSIAETVATAIGAAIATPTVGTIVAATATVGLIIGAGYLIYRGIKYVGEKADSYITNKCNPDDLPHREPFKTLASDYSKDNSYDNISRSVCNNTHESDRYTKRFDLNRDSDIPYIGRYPRYESRFDIDRDYALRSFNTIDTYRDDSGALVSILEPSDKKKKKHKNKKYKLNKIAEVAKYNKKINDLNAGNMTADEYFDSLPFIANGNNITCIC